MVSTVTTGDSLDVDGYMLTLGALSDSIGINDTVTFGTVPVGTSVLVISDVASNCSASAGDSISITLADGDTVSASFAIACTAPAAGVGTVVVSTATTGDSLDVDGYVVSLGALSDSIGINDTVTFDSVPAGMSTVTISGIASNCMTTGGDSISVTVGGGRHGPGTVRDHVYSPRRFEPTGADRVHYGSRRKRRGVPARSRQHHRDEF